jgi:hypothetical protein
MNQKKIFSVQYQIIALVLQPLFPGLAEWCTAKKEKTLTFNEGDVLEVSKMGSKISITFQTTVAITFKEYQRYFQGALKPVNE